MKRILAYALLLLLLAAGSYSATATCYTCVQYMNQSPLCHDYVIPEQGFGLTYCYQMEYGCPGTKAADPILRACSETATRQESAGLISRDS